jgi:hypothetical protein
MHEVDIDKVSLIWIRMEMAFSFGDFFRTDYVGYWLDLGHLRMGE